jgi:WD40 repeat protein
LPKHAVQRFGSTAFAAGEYFQEIAYIGDGQQILSRTGGSQSFHLWAAATGELLSTFEPPGFQMSCWDGESLILSTRRVATKNQTQLEILELPGMKLVNSWSEDGHPYGLAISRGGKRVAYANYDWTVTLFDGTTQKQTDRLPPLESKSNVAGYPKVALSPAGDLLVIVDSEGWHYVRPVDAEGKCGEQLGKFRGTSFGKIKFPDLKDQLLVLGGNSARLINYRTGVVVQEFVHGRVSILDVDYDRKLRRLATCGADGNIVIWDLEQGVPVHTLVTEERHPSCVAFAPNGNTLVSGGGRRRARFWNVLRGEEIVRRGGHEFDGAIYSLALSPDGETLAIAGGLGDVTVWDAKTGLRRGVLPDDQEISRVKYDPMVRPDFLAFTPQGDLLVSGSNNRHNSLNIWDVATLSRRTRGEGHPWPLMCVAVSPAGQPRLASSSRDETIRVWNLRGETEHTFPKEQGGGNTLVFTPDGRYLLADGKNNTVKVLDPEQGKLVHTLAGHTAGVVAIRCHPHKPEAFSCDQHGKVRVWNTDNWRMMREFSTLPRRIDPAGRQLTIACAALSPAGERLVVGEGRGALFVTNTENGERIAELTGHRGAISAVAWHPDGKLLYSAASDTTILVWDVPRTNQADEAK